VFANGVHTAYLRNGGTLEHAQTIESRIAENNQVIRPNPRGPLVRGGREDNNLGERGPLLLPAASGTPHTRDKCTSFNWESDSLQVGLPLAWKSISAQSRDPLTDSYDQNSIRR
jgi:hypothetical protein